jgi:hypothetical protein
MPILANASQSLMIAHMILTEMDTCSFKTCSTSLSTTEHIAILSEDPSLKNKTQTVKERPMGAPFVFEKKSE